MGSRAWQGPSVPKTWHSAVQSGMSPFPVLGRCWVGWGRTFWQPLVPLHTEPWLARARGAVGTRGPSLGASREHPALGRRAWVATGKGVWRGDAPFPPLQSPHGPYTPTCSIWGFNLKTHPFTGEVLLWGKSTQGPGSRAWAVSAHRAPFPLSPELLSVQETFLQPV